MQQKKRALNRPVGHLIFHAYHIQRSLTLVKSFLTTLCVSMFKDMISLAMLQ